MQCQSKDSLQKIKDMQLYKLNKPRNNYVRFNTPTKNFKNELQTCLNYLLLK